MQVIGNKILFKKKYKGNLNNILEFRENCSNEDKNFSIACVISPTVISMD